MTQNNNHIKAGEGKTFVRKGTDEVISTEIWLGKGDSADNYEEIDIDIPKQEENEN